MTIGIQIGASKDSLHALAACIIEVLSSCRTNQFGEQVALAALVALEKGSSITNASISGCSVSMHTHETSAEATPAVTPDCQAE